MSDPQVVELTPAGASALLRDELAQAADALAAADLDAALDGYVRTLGLALQIGPAPTEHVLQAVLQAAAEIAQRGDAQGLAQMGPSLVGLVRQVDEAEALPGTPVMEAWATVAADLGTLIGQVGLALSLPSERRAELWANARRHAALLDEATHGLFALCAWLDALPSS